jgi:hypothetical protein
VKKAQLPSGQIQLTSMGIKQGARGQVQGHGIDRQIAPGQIVLEGAELHHWVVARNGIGLGAGARHIQKESGTVRRGTRIDAISAMSQFQFQFHGAVLTVRTRLPHPEGRSEAGKIFHQLPGRRGSLTP